MGLMDGKEVLTLPKELKAPGEGGFEPEGRA
jgi:hypothetical protein